MSEEQKQTEMTKLMVEADELYRKEDFKGMTEKFVAFNQLVGAKFSGGELLGMMGLTVAAEEIRKARS